MEKITHYIGIREHIACIHKINPITCRQFNPLVHSVKDAVIRLGTNSNVGRWELGTNFLDNVQCVILRCAVHQNIFQIVIRLVEHRPHGRCYLRGCIITHSNYCNLRILHDFLRFALITSTILIINDLAPSASQ